jgi:hypothetical protein
VNTEKQFLLLCSPSTIYARSFVYEMYDRMRVPSKVNLVAIESPEADLMSNKNATDYAKRLFKWIDATLPASEQKGGRGYLNSRRR